MDDASSRGNVVKVIGLSEFKEVDGKYYTRKRGKSEWTEVESPPAPTCESETPLILSLIRETQTEGEPNHWLLYVSRESAPGLAYQVTGDAENMTYVPPEDECDATLSPSFLDSFQLATVTEAEARIVAEVASNEPPPKAPNRLLVTENCQGWAVRVTARLVERGIVGSTKLESVSNLVEPIR